MNRTIVACIITALAIAALCRMLDTPTAIAEQEPAPRQWAIAEFAINQPPNGDWTFQSPDKGILQTFAAPGEPDKILIALGGHPLATVGPKENSGPFAVIQQASRIGYELVAIISMPDGLTKYYFKRPL